MRDCETSDFAITWEIGSGSLRGVWGRGRGWWGEGSNGTGGIHFYCESSVSLITGVNGIGTHCVKVLRLEQAWRLWAFAFSLALNP